ncbi:S-adenosylmethionine sensor upstream of mTORC1 [Pieris rapae]|uniref:S-adenosylmethionine sensor upstream of mTORC1 n=1 Tax=Pieris rapae TaxID=64459 RepID=UPI001E2804E7|nr:S-adenosylmethionine sensor upstream of mTORC1 [Pieris rapae]
MASEKHKELAQYIKEVHANLRKNAAKLGPNNAWMLHTKNEEVLLTYAKYMQELATTYWEKNSANESCLASSRIEWSVKLCTNYFANKEYIKYRERDIAISKKLNLTLNFVDLFQDPLMLLDVGSCYNPFRAYKLFHVLAVDLCPANDYVKKCDILEVNIGNETIIHDNTVMQLKKESFNIITFCFLLEYLPSSELRIKACENAYKLLIPEGVLIINTPDSKHVGANCKLMKCWQYTLACLGFTRIKYEKLTHMHCMGFRKALHKDVAFRWATIHRKADTDFAMKIPQDFIKREHKIWQSKDLKLLLL